MAYDDPRIYVESPCKHAGATPACPCGDYFKTEYNPPRGFSPFAAFGSGLAVASLYQLAATTGSALFLGIQGLILLLVGVFWYRSGKPGDA